MRAYMVVLVAGAVLVATAPAGADDMDDIDDIDALDDLDTQTSSSIVRLREVTGFASQELRTYVFDRGGAGEDE